MMLEALITAPHSHDEADNPSSQQPNGQGDASYCRCDVSLYLGAMIER